MGDKVLDGALTDIPLKTMTTKAYSMWFIQNNAVTDYAWAEAEHMFTYTKAHSTQMLWGI